MSFWTKETVRSTFADDAERVFTEVFKGRGTIERNSAPDPRLPQFTADMVLRPKAQGRSVAVFLVQEVAKLSEALLVWQTLQSESDDPLPVAALIEETNTVALTSPKVQRAVNRLDETTWFRHDEAGAARQILKLVDFSPTLHPS